MAGPTNIFTDCQKGKATSHRLAHLHKPDMKLFVESIRCLSFELDHKRWPMSLEAAGCGYVISRWAVALLIVTRCYVLDALLGSPRTTLR